MVGFCRAHRALLRADGYGTFFLFEGEDGGFFVAFVDFDDFGRLAVRVGPFSVDYVWGAEWRHRVVVPQLAA